MDEALKKEAASEAKSDNFSSIMKVSMLFLFITSCELTGSI